MTTLEKIKATGGFLDCGAIGSMPLGYFLDGTPARTHEYHEVMELKKQKKVVVTGEKGNTKGYKAYLTNYISEGSLLKAP